VGCLPAAWRAPFELLPRTRSRPIGGREAPTTEHRPARLRVLLLDGCVQSILAPSITAAACELLRRLGAEVTVQSGCCGALSEHLGREADAKRFEQSQLRAFDAATGPVDAIAVTASGCGTHIKAYADARYASRARDIIEIVAELGLPSQMRARKLRVAYQSPCSLQYAQKIADLPQRLLRQAGFEVHEPIDAGLCCGSAGTYNLLQPELSRQLREQKLAAIAALEPAVLASGNIGCMMQLADAAGGRIAHTVELLLWAVGGPRPAGLMEADENG
jgi:glycolate oxidase iron-sulfur subunit